MTRTLRTAVTVALLSASILMLAGAAWLIVGCLPVGVFA